MNCKKVLKPEIKNLAQTSRSTDNLEVPVLCSVHNYGYQGDVGDVGDAGIVHRGMDVPLVSNYDVLDCSSPFFISVKEAASET